MTTTETETKATRRPDRVELALAVGVAVLVFGLMHIYGNTSDVSRDGASLFLWLGRQLLARSGDFSHGWAIPIVCLGIVIWKRRELAAAAAAPSGAGLAVVIASLMLHWVALRAQQPRVSLVALVGLLWGIPCFLYGRRVAGILLFPCGYLLLSFTTYVLVYFSFPLRLMSSAMAAGVLNGLGIATTRAGTVLQSTAGGGFTFEVAAACSGLRSLFVMTALAAPYAYLTQKTVPRKWALFLLSIPLAIVTNALRIVTVGLVAEAFGQDTAIRVYHDFSGYLAFAISIVLLTSAGAALERTGKREKTASPPQQGAREP